MAFLVFGVFDILGRGWELLGIEIRKKKLSSNMIGLEF